MITGSWATNAGSRKRRFTVRYIYDRLVAKRGNVSSHTTVKRFDDDKGQLSRCREVRVACREDHRANSDAGHESREGPARHDTGNDPGEVFGTQRQKPDEVAETEEAPSPVPHWSRHPTHLALGPCGNMTECRIEGCRAQGTHRDSSP